MRGQPPAPTSFSILRTLGDPAQLPKKAQVALQNLRAFVAARGGSISRSELKELPDELARLVAHNAARHRSVLQALENGPPVPFQGRLHIVRFLTENLARLKELELSGNPTLHLRDFDEAWFATYYTRLLTMEAWNYQPGSYGKGPMTSDVLRGTERELVRLLGIHEALEKAPANARRKRDLLAQHAEASKQVLLAAYSGASDPKNLLRAAKKTMPVLREVYRSIASRPGTSALDATPEVVQQVLGRLGREGVYSLKVAAAKDQQAELGALPALKATAAFLEAEGILDGQTFKDLVVRLRSHALPSFAQLLNTMERYGLRNYEVDASKGVSTNPLAVAAMERSAAKVDPAYRDGWRAPEVQAKLLVGNMVRSFNEARRLSQPLLVLGEGFASARALHDAAEKYPDVRTGYVAFTQSGLNFLGDQKQLRFFVESLADAILKKLSESRPLGEWVVDRELELQREAGARPPAEQTAVVIGFGDSVGPGIARALRDKGFAKVVVVDKDLARLEQAKREGFTDTVLAQADGSLPPGDLYFTAAGRPNLINEQALRSVPSGAVVVIHGSSVESDKHFIHQARTGKIKGVKAKALEKEKLPDHRTLEITFHDQGKKTARLRKMGQPFFDGRDKDRLLVDVYMSGLLAALAVAAKRLKSEVEPAAIHTLDTKIQLGIAERILESYGVDFTAALRS